MERYRDAYELLGIHKGATLQEIKAAYRAKVKKCHPDLCAPGERAAAEAYFKELSAAYNRLSSRGASWHQAQAEWHAAAAETMATGHTGAQYARTAAGVAAKAPPKFSNGVIAAVLALPLVLSGFHLSRAYNNLQNDPFTSMRPAGVLGPSHNPYLREDLRPRTHSSRFFKAVHEWREARAGGQQGGRQQAQRGQRGQQQQQQQAAA